MTARSGRRLVLVGFQDQDNLGIRYLMSAVEAAGFEPTLVTYDSKPESLLSVVKRHEPVLIGFSLIFQYMAPDFAQVIAAVRECGYAGHITMGGHYPSFDPKEVLERIPGLDSIARFEGERTLVELLTCLDAGNDWRALSGIAFRSGDEVVVNPIRAAVEDLDILPWPQRNDIPYESQALPTASVLASRGCPWDCTFCSIRPFYEAQEGPLRRFRRAERVVDEMETIHRQRGVCVFLFQDDDFLGGGKRARAWAIAIAREIVARELGGKLAFKVSCRSDEIERDCISELATSGLTHIYMGVENGDPQGLINMSKRIKPEQHLRAGEILRSIGLSFDFGFMLLDPYSTFGMIRNNIDFLDQFVGDGWSAASFCRMLPYAGTPLKARLEKEGRLLGSPFEPDYHFLDERIDVYYEWMLRTFHERNFTNRGLCHILKSLLFEARLRLPDRNSFSTADRAHLIHLTALCNGYATATLRSALRHVEREERTKLAADEGLLAELTASERESEREILRQVVDLYWSARQRQKARQEDFQLYGGFRNAWTTDRPAVSEMTS